MKCCWDYKSKMVCNHQDNNEILKLKTEIGNSARKFSFKELQKLTNNFSTKLGIGELSTCYKGNLENGTVVAAKVFIPRTDLRMYLELRVLIKIMAEIRHPNVVGFIGSCVIKHLPWLTSKGDVYAFGVILLEVISGRRIPKCVRDDKGSGGSVAKSLKVGEDLVDWARQLGQDGRYMEIVDPTLSEFPEDEVKCLINVALSCVHLSSNLRPRMSEVSLLLSGGCGFSANAQNKPDQSS